MKILIFGGSGFLGSHTADALSELKHKVTIFDAHKSPYLTNKQEMIVGDIMDKKAVKKAIKNKEIVYNFAAISDIKKANENPIETIEKNIMGNTYILNECKEEKVKRYIFASSVYIYNDISSFYGTTKKCCELLIENYQRAYGTPFTILRYGTLYGTRAQSWNGVYELLHQAITKKKIIFDGSGNEERELINVKDAAQLNAKILEKKYENNHLILTGMQKIKWSSLTKTINEMMGGELEIIFTRKVKNRKNHYEITPYIFKPQTALKITATDYHDLGQGLLECMNEIYLKKKV